MTKDQLKAAAREVEEKRRGFLTLKPPVAVTARIAQGVHKVHADIVAKNQSHIIELRDWVYTSDLTLGHDNHA